MIRAPSHFHCLLVELVGGVNFKIWSLQLAAKCFWKLARVVGAGPFGKSGLVLFEPNEIALPYLGCHQGGSNLRPMKLTPRLSGAQSLAHRPNLARGAVSSFHPCHPWGFPWVWKAGHRRTRAALISRAVVINSTTAPLRADPMLDVDRRPTLHHLSGL